MILTGDDELGLALARDIVAVRAAMSRLLGRLRLRSLESPGAPPASDQAPFGFPMMLDVRARRVVVAGGGREAANKADALASLGAAVTVWAPVHSATAALAGRPHIVLRSGAFNADVLDGALLAIIATEDSQLNQRIATLARSRRVLVNTVDDIPFCDWSAPAILRRGDLTVAVATAGIAPALAVRVRDGIGLAIGPEYAGLLEALGRVRPRIMATGRSFDDRRRLWYELVDGPALAHLRVGREDDARSSIEAAIAAWEVAE